MMIKIPRACGSWCEKVSNGLKYIENVRSEIDRKDAWSSKPSVAYESSYLILKRLDVLLRDNSNIDGIYLDFEEYETVNEMDRMMRNKS